MHARLTVVQFVKGWLAAAVALPHHDAKGVHVHGRTEPPIAQQLQEQGNGDESTQQMLRYALIKAAPASPEATSKLTF